MDCSKHNAKKNKFINVLLEVFYVLKRVMLTLFYAERELGKGSLCMI